MESFSVFYQLDVLVLESLTSDRSLNTDGSSQSSFEDKVLQQAFLQTAKHLYESNTVKTLDIFDEELQCFTSGRL